MEIVVQYRHKKVANSNTTKEKEIDMKHIYKINYTHKNKFFTYEEEAPNKIVAVQNLFTDLLKLSKIEPQEIEILSITKIK